MASRKLFGTDGVRGVANRELTPELALSIGRALGGRLAPGARVMIGRDTRRSGPMLEAALAAGLSSAGADVVLLGVIPTPAVAELVAGSDAAAGAVISASHNPFADNGIKLFGGDGFKLADADEAAVEAALEEPGERPEAERLGAIASWDEGRTVYIDSLLARSDVDLSGLSIVVDCANGATTVTAPEVFARLGATVETIGAQPDGVNINAGCGSTDLGLLSASVVRAPGPTSGSPSTATGTARWPWTPPGAVVDGDQILAICALDLRARGELPGDAVVTTTMTNLGFRRAMAGAGIEVRWTDVGDRYVLEEMRRGGYVLGGEQSGHLINLAHGPSGDGLAAALHLLRALAGPGRGPRDGRRGDGAAAPAAGQRPRGAKVRATRCRWGLGGGPGVRGRAG